MNNYTLKMVAALVCAVIPLFLKAHPTIGSSAQQPRQLSFIENKGQITDQNGKARKDIDVKLSAGGLNVFIGDGSIHYQWSRNKDAGKSTEHLPPHERMDKMQEQMMKPSVVDMYRMDVTLVDANTHAEVIKEEKQEYYERYYTASLGEDGALAHTFNKITYKDIYPNIDWVLYSKNNELKYDFAVHPGGNAADIKLKYGGATALKLEKGVLTATTPYGNITEDKPYTYDANTKQAIASSFILNGDVLSFNVAQHEGTVVIDPTINWGTYYGGSGLDFGYSVAADNAGNSILVGSTSSSNNIVTNGAFQTTLNSAGSDAFLVKFNIAGVRLWSTYYGDSGNEYFASDACDLSGNIYAGGQTTSSSGIASTGAHQTTWGGGSNADAMLVKFSPTGARLWSTYYGGSGLETRSHVACDNLGNVFLSGETQSTNNISTTGSHQPNSNITTTTYDTYLAKFSAGGARQWGSYYGGTGFDKAGGLTCDLSGNVFLSGSTSSTTDIATMSSHQPANAGLDDAYLIKFNGSGVRQWGTYYGGMDTERGYNCAADDMGNVYLVGHTWSTSGIATAGAHKAIYIFNSITDGYVVKFNASGVRQWGSYYGGSNGENMTGVATASDGHVYTYGSTYSTSGIAMPNGYQTTYGGGSADGFLVEWSSIGTPSWATYYGGSGFEGNNESFNCAWSMGYVYIAGSTYSTSGIATLNGHQTAHASSSSAYDAFLVSFKTDTIVYIQHPFFDTVFCPGDTFKLRYGVNHNFNAGNVFTAQLSNAAGNFGVPVTIGSKTSSVADTIVCIVPTNMPAGNGYRIRIVSTTPFRTSMNNGLNIRIKAAPSNLSATANTPVCEGSTLNLAANGSSSFPISYTWSGPLNFSSTNANNSIPNVTVAHAGEYIVKANDGQCTTADTVTVAVNTIPATPTATIDSPICYGETLNMTAVSTTPGVTYNWTGPSGYTSNQANPSILSASTANSGTYSVTATKLGCTSPAATVKTLVYPKTPLPAVPDSAIQCVGSTLNIAPANIPGATYAWTGPNGFTATAQNLNIPLAQLFHRGYYLVTATLNGCPSDVDSVFAKINIKAKIGGYASPNDTVCAGTFMTYVAMQNNGGPTPLYQWYRNYQPIAGANSLLYTSSNVTNGEKFHCTMYSVGVCDLPVTVSTDTLEMVVLPIVTKPSATISSNPTLPQPNELAVFTAQVQNGGPNPKYQWQLNGVDQVGATYATWSAATLRPFDKVNVVITSDDPCTNIKTAVSDTIMVGFPTNVTGIKNDELLSLYPNPNKGMFTIKGSSNFYDEAQIEVINAVGQTVYRTVLQPVSKMLNVYITLPNNIANGVYLLRMNAADQTKHIRFTLNR